jgi:4-hydroxybenzoate polyprenyltransferase
VRSTERARGLLNLTRLHAANWEVLVFLLGPLVIGVDVWSPVCGQLIVLAALVNAFIFTLNDLADLPRDRLDPHRWNSPLVSGAVTLSAALLLVCLEPIAMWAVIASARWPVRAQLGFVTLLALGAVLCVFQKTSRRVHPLVLDLGFGVCMAGPVPVSIVAAGHSVPSQGWAIAAAFFVLSVELNVVGGNLKDLEADEQTGFMTVALSLGVVARGDQPIFTRAFRTLIWVCQIALAGTFVWVLVAAGADRSAPILVGAAVVAAAGWVAMSLSLRRLLTNRRPPGPRGRDVSLAIGMATLLILVSLFTSFVDYAVVLGGVAGYEFFFRWFWSRSSPGAPSSGSSGATSRT